MMMIPRRFAALALGLAAYLWARGHALSATARATRHLMNPPTRRSPMADPYTHEFVCCECKRNIVLVGTLKRPEPPLCAHCLSIPGWHEDPLLKKIFGHYDELPEGPKL
jgi:hypothetical protein